MILELGANDALRGIDPKLTKATLDDDPRQTAASGILPVLLAGMLAPRNMGADYAEAFDAIYPALASTHAVVFYPFFLDGVAGDPKLESGRWPAPERRRRGRHRGAYLATGRRIDAACARARGS